MNINRRNVLSLLPASILAHLPWTRSARAVAISDEPDNTDNLPVVQFNADHSIANLKELTSELLSIINVLPPDTIYPEFPKESVAYSGKGQAINRDDIALPAGWQFCYAFADIWIPTRTKKFWQTFERTVWVCKCDVAIPHSDPSRCYGPMKLCVLTKYADGVCCLALYQLKKFDDTITIPPPVERRFQITQE